MKWGKTTLLLTLFSLNCFSQEICNNAIDDDSDGLIDLNDSDCICNYANSNSNIASYIPNASFENYSLCPTAPSQMSRSNNWSQCTMTTADYINTCGYVLEGIGDAGLLPFPDGQAIAGVILSNEWREYIGIDLTTTMEAGKNYQMTFNIASLPVNGDGETCNNGIINYSAINITLYGSANSGTLPVNTIAAPTNNPEWMVIGTAVYQPAAQWGQLTITFTPSINISAVMLGAPEVLPSSYSDNTCYPYFLFDNLILNEASAAGVNITATGDFCNGNLALSANTAVSVSNNAVYQWYKGGVAITGATNTTLSITSADSMIGNYAVKVTDQSLCLTSTSYTVTATMADPVVSSVQSECSTGTATIILADTADLYSFNNGYTWSVQNVSSSLQPGTYYVKTKSLTGCESLALPVVVAPNIINVPQVSDADFCQYSQASPLTASGSNLLWYTTASGGSGSAIAPIPSTQNTGVTTFYVSQTVNGCESGRAALNVYVTPSPSAPIADDMIAYCQFSETAPLSASGANLLWYTDAVGGTGKSQAPVPLSNTPGMTIYYVSQVKNGCESMRKPITVVIFEAPKAPHAKTYVAYGQNTSAVPLTAYGENLSWYDEEGRILSAAPVPETSNIGTTAFYVSQTIEGCESIKTEIIVEVIPKAIAVNYPKFFTPNGDGVHEQWNIYSSNTDIAGDVFIYDRNGQMIQQMKTTDRGWDGTFNGRTLPATDYWFKVIYTEFGEEKEFSSHFSLVR